MGVKRRQFNSAYGLNNPLQELAPQPIVAARAPATNDFAELGTLWVDTSGNNVYVLSVISSNSATWEQISTTLSPVAASLTLTENAGGTALDVSGNNSTTTISSNTINLDAAAGTTTISGNLTVAGTTTLQGDIDITTTAAFDVTATGNQDPAILLRTNGGTTETLQLINSQGTAVDSIEVTSTAGGVEVNSAGLMAFVSSRNNAQAILMNASAGGIDITAAGAAGEDIDITCTAGSVNITSGETSADSLVILAGGGLDLLATGAAGVDMNIENGAGSIAMQAGEAAADAITLTSSNAAGGIQLHAGTGGILIGNQADCTTIDVGDIAPTGSRTITVGGGTVVTASVTDTIDIGPDGATTNADSIKTVNINTGGVTTGQVLTNIATGAITSGTHTVSVQSGNAAAGTVALNLSTGTGTKTVNVGNSDANTTINIDGVFLVNDSVNANTSINTGTSTGTVSIGNAAAGAVTVDTAAGISLDAATASNFTVANNALTIASGTGALSISADAAATTVNVGTGAAAKTVSLGSTNTTSTTTVQSGSGGSTISSSGDVDLVSTNNAADAVYIRSNGGTSETIRLHADQGSGANSITLQSDGGGVTVTTAALAATTGLHVTQSAQTAAIQVGTGAPAHSAPQGSLYLRTDGSSTSTRLYINTNGTTGWTNVVTAA